MTRPSGNGTLVEVGRRKLWMGHEMAQGVRFHEYPEVTIIYCSGPSGKEMEAAVEMIWRSYFIEA